MKFLQTVSLRLLMMLALVAGTTGLLHAALFSETTLLGASDATTFKNFGFSVDVEGNTAAVGAWGDQKGKGAVYIFTLTNGTWTQTAKIVAPDGADVDANPPNGDAFGASVSLSGDRLAVGALLDKNGAAQGAGSVYIFLRTGGVWSLEKKIQPADASQVPGEGDQFGVSVSLDGDTIAVGANLVNYLGTANVGATYVFVRSGSNWVQQAKLFPSTTNDGAWAGNSVSLQGNDLIAGAPYTGTGGAVYWYQRSGSVWTEKSKIVKTAAEFTSDGNPNSGFGSSVSLSNGTALVGVPSDDTAASGFSTNAGSVFVYTLAPAGLAQQARLRSLNSPVQGYFGAAVVLVGDMALIAATAEAPNGRGAVYVFTRSGSTWSQTERLVPSSVQDADRTGYALAFDGTTALASMVRPDFSGNVATYTSITPGGGTPPQAISVSPNSGSGGRQKFQFVARDVDGASNIWYVQMNFSPVLSGFNACYVHHDPANNIFYLLNDDGSQWFGLIGGTPNNVTNSQCLIHGATSGSTRSGNDVTVSLDVSFRGAFTGTQKSHLFVGDLNGNESGWQQVGTWNPSGDPSLTEFKSITPAAGSGANQLFTLTLTDGDGANNIWWAQININSALDGKNACYIHYDPATNVFYLLNDATTQWFGVFGNTGGTVENSQCRLRATSSGSTKTGNDLAVTYQLEFKPGFAGAKNIYVQGSDLNGNFFYWQKKGTFTVQ